MEEHVTGQPSGDGTAQVEPAPDEAVSPVASDAADHDEPHASDAPPDAHGGGHGHGPALGPIDWRAYGAGVVGAALGLVVAAILAVSTGYVTL
jgi:hypothetical protein